MKMKKTLAVAASLAMAASAMSAFSAGASAVGGSKIDFEDGDFSFVYLNTDAADCTTSGLEVVDWNGSKALHLYVPAKHCAKIWFDIDSIMPRATALEVSKITWQMQTAPEDENAFINWCGGNSGTAGGFDRVNMTGGSAQKDPNWNEGTAYELAAYNPGEASPVVDCEKKFLLPTSKYTETSVNPFLGVMIWGIQAKKGVPTKGTDENGEEVETIEQGADCGLNLYIDNITFLDKDGNALDLGVSDAAPAAAETEAVTEAATEAPAEEVAEPETEAVEEVVEDEIVLEEPEFVPEADDEPIAVEEAAPVVEEAAPAVEAAPAAVPATSNTNTGNVPAAAVASVMILAAAAMAASKRK
ncbi:MAG: hypothetical protein IKR73_08815 [Oscillospiraceae bacterium]|nr:hypothetical protein [Oscillospiraceae bacterium]